MGRLGDVPYVAKALLPALLDSLNKQGIEADGILRQARIDPRVIASNTEFMPLQWLADFLEAGASRTGDPYFGLHANDWIPLRFESAPLYALINAPDLRTALVTLTRYIRISVSIRMAFEDQGATGRLEWGLSEVAVPSQQLADFQLGRFLRHVRGAAGPDWRPLSARLMHRRPNDTSTYEQRLGHNIRFNQPVNCIVIDGAALSTPMPGADPRLFRLMTRYCDQLLGEPQFADDPITLIRHQLTRELPRNATLEALAGEVGLTPVQFRRVLKRSKLSYKDLIDSTRQTLARHYLMDTDLPLYEVGERLGFSEQSAFSRAARRWFGATPSKVRRWCSSCGVSTGCPPRGEVG